METLQLIGSATGLGFLAGLRLYATILTLGLLIRFDVINLRPEFQPLESLANWWVMGVAGVAFLLEFFADKIPWVDSAWDALHTFIRPLGAILIAAMALGEVNPILKIVASILAGGVAVTSHSMKSATRLAVNQSPEPVSNSVLSFAGDFAVPVGVWMAMEYPILIGSIVGVAVIVFLAISPRIYRALRLQAAAVAGLFRRVGSSSASELEPLPAEYVDALSSRLTGPEPKYGLRVAAGRGISRLGNSIGYLCRLEDEALFVTRRWFRYRTYRFPLVQQEAPEYRKGILLDRLVFRDGARSHQFMVFRDGRKKAEAFIEDTTPVPARV